MSPARKITRYNVDSQWDDPCERPQERRDAVRFALNLKIMIALDSGSARRKLVGPGLVRDLSEKGVGCLTRHDLSVGQSVTLRFPTDDCPAEMFLPKAFYGLGRVVRVIPDESDVIYAGIEFGGDLLQNMEFAMYIQHMEMHALTQ